MTDFVPRILGFQPKTREDAIQRHTRQRSKDLMSSSIAEDPAILVLGGKYVYIQEFQLFFCQEII